MVQLPARAPTSREDASLVLIADDEPSIRHLVRETLMSDSIKLLEAADGNEAWSMIEQHQPRVVVLDVRMPGKTGLELAQAIRATPLLASTHVILLTANRRPEDVSAGLAAGADLYLTKPFSPLQLLDAVEQACAAV